MRHYETCPECKARGVACHLCFGAGQVYREEPDMRKLDVEWATAKLAKCRQSEDRDPPECTQYFSPDEVEEMIDEIILLSHCSVNGVPDAAVCFFMDGNKWCCVNGDFINLKESPAGFGDTFDTALEDLKKNLCKGPAERALQIGKDTDQ